MELTEEKKEAIRNMKNPAIILHTEDFESIKKHCDSSKKPYSIVAAGKTLPVIVNSYTCIKGNMIFIDQG